MNMTLRMAILLYNDLKKIALEEEKSINKQKKILNNILTRYN